VRVSIPHQQLLVGRNHLQREQEEIRDVAAGDPGSLHTASQRGDGEPVSTLGSHTWVSLYSDVPRHERTQDITPFCSPVPAQTFLSPLSYLYHMTVSTLIITEQKQQAEVTGGGMLEPFSFLTGCQSQATGLSQMFLRSVGWG
jgi:hypothetical protein